MVRGSRRRRIDWSALGEVPRARRVDADARWSEVPAIVADLRDAPSAEAFDEGLRHAVEFARDALGLERSAIFLVEPARAMMTGTWGTGARGETVDEHGIAFESAALDREVFARADAGLLWTVYQDCPLIAQVDGETRILGRGWVGCTAILGARGPVGILFNDRALSGGPVDEVVQSRAAVLACTLGPAIEQCSKRIARAPGGPPAPHPLVQRVAALLAEDPTLTCDGIASRLHVSARRVARTFKLEASVSVVDHRNDVRLTRFLELADRGAPSLAAAALDAGFGSYAQFHRVFRARFGRAPRDYLLEQGRERRRVR